MTEPPFHSVRGDQANELIPLLLGAMSLLDDFAAAACDASPGPSAANRPKDDALLAAALGLLSLRRTADRWARLASRDGGESFGDDARAPADLSMR
jgi:hypothetical protein